MAKKKKLPESLHRGGWTTHQVKTIPGLAEDMARDRRRELANAPKETSPDGAHKPAAPDSTLPVEPEPVQRSYLDQNKSYDKKKKGLKLGKK